MTKLTQDNWMKLFSENWAHIRHMEHYRMWSVNIYAVVVATLGIALGTGKIEPYFDWAAAFLMLFTIFNLLIALKIEAVIMNFAQANKIIRDRELKINEYIAPIRTRQWPWDHIRFQWMFIGFYCLVLIGITVLIVVR